MSERGSLSSWAHSLEYCSVPVVAAKAASLSLSATFVLWGGHAETRPEPVIATPDVAAVLAEYPALQKASSAPMEKMRYTDEAITYQYQGLDELSFTMPGPDIYAAVDRSATLEELEEAANPFFDSIGIDVRISDISEQGSGREMTRLEQDDIEKARALISVMQQQIEVIPRELLRFAGVAQVYFTLGSPNPDENWSALAWYAGDGREAMAFDVSGILDDPDTFASMFHHEFGHALARRLDSVTREGFSISYAALNPVGFEYENPDQPWHEASKSVSKYQAETVRRGVIGTTYSGKNIEEDRADTYESLWTGEMAPDPGDASFCTPIGYKRVLWIENIDQYVAGYQKYMLGRQQGSFISSDRTAPIREIK